MILLHIPLPPVPWQAPLRARGYCYDPKESDKRAARYYIAQQYKAKPLTDFTVLAFKFMFKVPKSYGKKKAIEALAGRVLPTRSDCTNLQKLYEDCLKGIVIDDDRKVIKIMAEKFYGKKDGIFISVLTLSEYLNMEDISNAVKKG